MCVSRAVFSLLHVHFWTTAPSCFPHACVCVCERCYWLLSPAAAAAAVAATAARAARVSVHLDAARRGRRRRVAYLGRAACSADGRLEIAVVGLHVVAVYKRMGHGGAGGKCLVPGIRGLLEQRLAKVTLVAVLELTVVEAGCGGTEPGGALRSALLLVHAGQEVDLARRRGLVERAHSGELPIAVILLDARAPNATDCRGQRERHTGVRRVEVAVQLEEVARAKLATSGSAGAEVVVDGDLGGPADEGEREEFGGHS